MTRDELVEVGAGMLRTMPADLPPMDRTTHARFIAASVINAVEPLIREDEVERRFGWVSQEDARAWFLADLRAKVEALPSAYIVAGVWVDARPLDDDEWGDKPAVLRDAVLALFDGGSDE